MQELGSSYVREWTLVVVIEDHRGSVALPSWQLLDDNRPAEDGVVNPSSRGYDVGTCPQYRGTGLASRPLFSSTTAQSIHSSRPHGFLG